MTRLGAMLLLVTILQAPGRGVEAPTTAPASQSVEVDLSDKKSLAANMGKQVIVEGTVVEAQWSPSGKVFQIHFKEGDQTHLQGAMFSKFRESAEKAFDGDLSDALEGARIKLAGKLQLYRDKPEIMIDRPNQITIIKKGPGKSTHSKPATQPSSDAPAKH